MTNTIDPRVTREVHRRKLESGEPLTKEDVETARLEAQMNPSLRNMAAYATAKSIYAEQEASE